ncbi:MAG: DUF58 domain-containing protein [Planctomycetota bacterium]
MKPTRTRLEVGPTGRVFLFVLALTLGAALFTQANLMFMALGLLGGLLLSSLVWAWLGMRGLELDRLPASHGVAGEELVLRYRLSKAGRVPVFSLVLTETWGKGRRGYKRAGPMKERPQRLLERPTGWVKHLARDAVCQAQSSCWPIRRGQLGLQAIELHSDFPFGVVRRVVVFEDPQEVLILPRLYRMTRQAMGAVTRLDAGGFHQLDKEGGSEEFYCLREYRKGDSMKIIDWKHSAKTGELRSRQLTQPVPPSLIIMLDLSNYAPANQDDAVPQRTAEDEYAIDRAISLAASLACDAYLAGYRVGLNIDGADTMPLRPHHSHPHRAAILETLALVRAGTLPSGVHAPSETPSVIVQAGGERGSLRRRRAVVLLGDELEKITVPIAPNQILASRHKRDRRGERPVLDRDEPAFEVSSQERGAARA